jgi:hypothetical protein
MLSTYRIVSTTALVALLSLAAHVSGGAKPKPNEADAELEKWQGLWQDFLGGMTHQNGEQVVRQPVTNGRCFFVCGDRLIWLTDDGRPSGTEERIALDVKANSKRISRTMVLSEGKKVVAAAQVGIYKMTERGPVVHFGLESGKAPHQFLELNKPAKGVDGTQWLIGRKKLGGE